MKTFHLPMTFAFPLSSSFLFPLKIFLKNCLPYPIFWKILPPSKKVGGTGREQSTNSIHLKIYITMFGFLRVFLLEYFDVFSMFLRCPCLTGFFEKVFQQNFRFYDQIKEKTDNSSHPPIKQEKQTHGNFSNQMNLKDSSVFWKSKPLGGVQLLVIHFKINFKIIHLIRSSTPYQVPYQFF